MSSFWRQMEATVFIILEIFFAIRAVFKIGKYIINSVHLAGKFWSRDAIRPIARERKI